MNEIINCPLCGIENNRSNSKCLKCGYKFTPNVKNQKQSANWLDDLRSSNENDIPKANSELHDDDLSQTDNFSNSPDWLTRIRDRKEIDDEYSKFTEQIIEQVDKGNNTNKTSDIIDNFRNQSDLDSDLNNESDNIISNLRDEENNNFFNSNRTSNLIDSSSNTLSKESENDQKDWFQRLAQVNNLESETNAIQNAEKNEDEVIEVPGWIHNSNVIQSLDTENEIFTEKAKEEVPDWVSQFDSFENSDEKREDEPVIPDWVQSSGLNSNDAEPSAQTPNEELPDWISFEKTNPTINQELEPVKPSLDVAPFDLESIHEIKDSEKGSINYQDSPTFSVSSDEEKNEKLEIDGLELSDISLADLPISPGLPKTRDKTIQKIQKEKPIPESNQFNLDSIPDWIGELDPNEEQIISQQPENNVNFSNQTDSGISPGELPNWLKAMRPIEAVTPNVNQLDNRKRIEKSGPLSGLKGVLSSEDVTKSYSLPPSYSVKLELSEKQKINAEVLDQVFSIDQSPETEQVKLPRNTELLFRFTISFILIIGLCIAFFTENQAITLPSIFPAETVRFTSISNGLLLSQETPPHILIIMDNEAASQAEINLLVRPVFERLMLKNSYISIISTNPNGVLVAMDILSKANLSVPTFISDERISNFGYLPGSTNGIQSFLSNPRTSLPVGVFPKDIWNSPGLVEIQSISQYDSIILVTDNPENSKSWLEQIRVSIPEMTILVTATSQASPLLQPYVDSDQIDGMVSGLYGSLTYSQLIQSESAINTSYWNMYKIGIYIFILIILLGGLFQLIFKIFKKSVTKEHF
jgi:hypothetical protein